MCLQNSLGHTGPVKNISYLPKIGCSSLIWLKRCMREYSWQLDTEQSLASVHSNQWKILDKQINSTVDCNKQKIIRRQNSNPLSPDRVYKLSLLLQQSHAVSGGQMQLEVQEQADRDRLDLSDIEGMVTYFQKHANTRICVFHEFSGSGTSQGPGSN